MSGNYAVVALYAADPLADHYLQVADRSVNNRAFWLSKADRTRARGQVEDEMSVWGDRDEAEVELERIRYEDRRPWVTYELREVPR